MTNVTIVVNVLITSCQVSLNPKIGPLTNQARIRPTARPKAAGLPVLRDVAFASRVNQERDLAARMPGPSCYGEGRAIEIDGLVDLETPGPPLPPGPDEIEGTKKRRG